MNNVIRVGRLLYEGEYWVRELKPEVFKVDEAICLIIVFCSLAVIFATIVTLLPW